MQTVGRLYVRYFNYGYHGTGTLFEGRYKSSVVQQEEYFLNRLRYIELNPVRAGMVNDPGDYKWSSYRAHAFGLKVKMRSPHALYSDLGMSDIARQTHYRKRMSEAMATEVLGKIRACLEKGLVLGTDWSREQVSGLMR
jgi:putative transposase